MLDWDGPVLLRVGLPVPPNRMVPQQRIPCMLESSSVTRRSRQRLLERILRRRPSLSRHLCACLVVNTSTSRPLLRSQGCPSIVGPDRTLGTTMEQQDQHPFEDQKTTHG